jgi:hypothetical protein
MLINSVPRGGLMICAVCWTGVHSNTLQEILNRLRRNKCFALAGALVALADKLSHDSLPRSLARLPTASRS